MLIARQTWALASRYEIRDEHGELRGRLAWPMFSQARNARLRRHPPGSLAGRVHIVADGLDLTADHEYLTRAWSNDTRYTLRDAGDRVLAQATMTFDQGLLRRGRMLLQQPGEIQLVKRGHLLRLAVVLEQDGIELGRIQDRKLLSVRRDMEMDLPGDLSLPVQIFVFFLACQMTMAT